MTGAASSRLVVRVTVGDTWTSAPIETSADVPIATVKVRALAGAHIPASDAPAYELKFGGALVRDETRTLGELGVRSGASLVVLSRRRRPVR